MLQIICCDNAVRSRLPGQMIHISEQIPISDSEWFSHLFQTGAFVEVFASPNCEETVAIGINRSVSKNRQRFMGFRENKILITCSTMRDLSDLYQVPYVSCDQVHSRSQSRLSLWSWVASARGKKPLFLVPRPWRLQETGRFGNENGIGHAVAM